MSNNSTNILLACLVSVGLFIQGGNALFCVTFKVQSCATIFSTSIASPGLDRIKICSAANSYLNCLNRISAECNLHPGSSSAISQAIDIAKHELRKAGCVSGASGPVYSITAIVLGVCLQRVF